MATIVAPAAAEAATQQAEAAAPAEATAEALGDVARLRRATHRMLAALVVLAVGSTAGVVAILPNHPLGAGSWRLMAVALLGGTLGSAASAIRSTCERINCGYVVEVPGRRIRASDRARKMTAGMLPYLLVRPVLGAATGLVAYAGVVGGFLIATATKQTPTFSGEGILFFALLAGLFAKTFLQRMDVVFKTLLGDGSAQGDDDTPATPGGGQ